MESARLKPILIHDPNTETGISESTLLDKECLNLRLDFYTGENPLKRKLDDMEFIINDLHQAKKYKKDNCIQIIKEKLL